MKVAFYSSTLGDQPAHEVIKWAKQAGFDGIELDVNRHLSGPESAGTIVKLARDAQLEVPSITLFVNLLHSDKTARKKIPPPAHSIPQEATNPTLPTLPLFPRPNAH